MITASEYFKDYYLNRHTGQWSHALQRLTGVLLAIYLIPHILVNSAALWGGRRLYDAIMNFVQGPLFHILEILIVLGVTFHALNGLRIILVDFFHLTKLQKPMVYVASILTFIVFVYSLKVYLPKILHHGASYIVRILAG